MVADIGIMITPQYSALSNSLYTGIQAGFSLGHISIAMPLLAREYNLSRSGYGYQVAGLATAWHDQAQTVRLLLEKLGNLDIVELSNLILLEAFGGGQGFCPPDT